MNINFKKRYREFLTVLFLLALPLHLFAVEFLLISPNAEMEAGSIITLSVLLDTEGESINAIEGKLLISDALEVLDINDGNSIVNFWVERPKIGVGSVSFSGTIPGGYNGVNGFLFSVTLTGVKNGGADITLSGISAFINDGLGTKSEATGSPYNIFIQEGTTSIPEITPPTDTALPESFVPLLSKDQNFFDGKYFIVFSTQDKISGIDHYEVAEEAGFMSFTYKSLPWVPAESPYVLKDQEQKSNIYIKAVDRQGNYRIVSIPPANQAFFYDYNWVFITILLCVVILYIKLRTHEF